MHFQLNMAKWIYFTEQNCITETAVCNTVHCSALHGTAHFEILNGYTNFNVGQLLPYYQ